QVFWQRNKPGSHSITDFEAGSLGDVCHPMGSPDKCPVTTYYSGGPGALPQAWLDTIVGRGMLTGLFTAAWHHVVKGGVDLELSRYQSSSGYSGTDIYQETTNGKHFTDFRQFGFLVGPDTDLKNVVPLAKQEAVSNSTTIGGFLQDSWS